MKIILTLLLIIVCTSEHIHAQRFEIGVSYSHLLDDSQNVGNINIVDYSSNKRLEISMLSKKWYSHVGLESLSFSENAVVSNSSTDHTSYWNNPGNKYDLSYLNLGLGWRSNPYNWLNLISGFTTGFLVNNNISFNNNLRADGYMAYPLNDLFNKSEAIKKIRINIFQTVEFEYSLKNSIALFFSYKFEVPLLPLISNSSNASSYFILSDEASENYLQFINVGMRYGF